MVEEKIQSMQHQVMGYDRAITMFSPDGRLLQVEYAKKTVKQGSTAIGITYKNGVLLLTDKRITDDLVIADSVEKIWIIDDHLLATAAGIISDARVLIDRAQVKAQQHKVTYDSPIDVLSVVKDICNLKQVCTQSGGLRPFGVSLLIAGADFDGPKLYETDPTGIYFRYKAAVIGEGEVEVEEILKKEYKENMSREDAIKLAMKAMYRFIKKNVSMDRIDAAYVELPEKKITKVSKKELEKYYSGISK
ncbi:MAG: archaeal proteasome endopeptidase complex subunit alpha [Candidatus Woesearchaeota archaeon]|nr:archaeal proteasome endopeptidase complex subunit alpha [Candidatus Woesearchaeota archaeon]